MTAIKNESGFSLLEVMIALTILMVALTAILTSQSGSIAITTRAKELNIASWLARNIMAESEHLFEGKKFSELPKEESKNFSEPFQRFKWTRVIKEVKFPEFALPSQKEGSSEGGQTEQMRTLGQTVTKFLNDSVREMVVTISWPRGNGEQRITVSTYLVDVDAKFNFSI